MSEFFIQDKQLSKVTRTVVKDETGHSLYLLVGRWGAKGDALSLYHMDGSLVASIKQISFTFGNRFEIYEDFQKVGTLHKIFNWPGDFYYIQQLKWQVHGNIYQHRYKIHHFTKEIMTMDKTTLLTGDYYVLNVANDADAPKCICIAAIMDYWLYKRNKQQKTAFKLKLSDTFN